MSKVAASIAARVSQLAENAPLETPEPAAATTTSASTSDPSASPPPVGDGSGVESGVVAAAPEPVDATQATQRELLAEKLRETRERREAQRLAERARRAQTTAETDRQAAAAERAKWEALKKGNFKEAITAMGRDPREVFEEMAAEAREAGKPEAQIARARADFDRQMLETVAPLKQEIEELKKERAAERAMHADQAFAQDFDRVIAKPEYVPLLVEYEPDTLFEIVRTMRAEPERLFSAAKRLNVRLTASPGRFTMTDICNVLRATHEEHERGREQRRARLQASTTSPGAPQQAPAKAPTVNGTAAKRNAAGNPLGNDLASTRATEVQAPRLTRRQRIQKLIDQGG